MKLDRISFSNIAILGLLLIFIGWNARPTVTPGQLRIIDGKPYVVSTEIIRATTAADLTSIPSTTADVLVCEDASATIANGTLTFPTAPINGQTISMTARSAITSLTLSTGGIPISGGITTLAAGATMSYVYNQAANRWFKNP